MDSTTALDEYFFIMISVPIFGESKVKAGVPT